MKGSTFLKRSLALVLTVVMLVSCWVFTAPTASAEAGTYYIKLTFDVDDPSDQTANGCKVWYTRQDGSEDTYTFEDTADSSGSGQTQTKSLDGVPYKMEVTVRCSGGTFVGSVQWYVTKLECFSDSNYSQNGKTLFAGKMGCYKGYITAKSTSRTYNMRTDTWSKSDWDGSSKQSSATTHWAPAPAKTGITMTSGATALSVKTNNTNETSTYTAKLIDQYGVEWNNDQSGFSYSVSSHTGASINSSSGLLTLTPDANASNNYNLTITATKTGYSNCTRTCTVTVFDYIVNFRNVANNGNVKTENVDYGSSATAPAAQSKGSDTTNHYNWDKWNGTYTNLTSGAQTKTVTPTFTTVAHNSSTYYRYTTNGTANHKKYCKDCNYTFAATESHTNATAVEENKVDSTCTQAGSYDSVVYCKYCNQQISRTNITIDEKGHDWTKQTVNASTKYRDATCEEAAKYWYSCSRCDAIEKNNNHTFTSGSALDHNWGNWVDDNNPTAEDINSGTHTKTCDRDGTHTQTANHSFGSWQQIPSNDTSGVHESHDRATYHFHECNPNGCGRIVYAEHNWVAKTPVPATCTEAGYTEYECSDCHQTTVNLNPGDSVPALSHNYEYYASGTKTDEKHQEKCSRCGDIRDVAHPSYGSWYSVDGTYHAHNCTVCDKQVKFTHEGNWSGWQHEVPTSDDTNPVRQAVRTTLTTAEYNHDKQCFNYCALCARVEYQNHTETSEVTTPATCTEKGITTYTCSACGNARTDTNVPALGHQVTLVHQELSDEGSDSIVAYYCSVCEKYIKATYSEALHEYTYNESETGQSSISDFSEVADKVPSPKINYASRNADQGEQYIDYVARGASLKLEGNPSFVVVPNDTADYRQTRTNNTQILRFIAAINLPDGFDESDIYPNSQEDSAILDFGFVYTQREAYVKKKGKEGKEVKESDWKNILKFNEGDNSKETLVYKMSVAEQNDYKPFVDGWTGCTLRPGQDENDYLTFNLLINITAKNWACDYLARSYITYKYHGITYTVYDEGHSLELNEYPGYDQDNITNYCYSFNNVAWVALQGICDTFSNETPYSVKYLLIKIWGSRNYWDINKVMEEVYCDYLYIDADDLDAAYEEAIGNTNT